jgi:hypothetical protein
MVILIVELLSTRGAINNYTVNYTVMTDESLFSIVCICISIFIICTYVNIYMDIFTYVQTREKYVSISSDGDIDSGIINQPEDWRLHHRYHPSNQCIPVLYTFHMYIYIIFISIYVYGYFYMCKLKRNMCPSVIWWLW